ncbi:hypothetical protein [Streptomyces sp. NPDC001492]
MTQPAARVPLRRNARSNRARILATAAGSSAAAMLLGLARRDLGAERVTEPAVLSAGFEALTVALLEDVNTGALEDDGTRTAVATLIATGVPEKRAGAVVEEVAVSMPREQPAADG